MGSPALQQRLELLHAYASVTKDTLEHPSIQLPVIGNRYDGMGLQTAKDKVTSVLPAELEANLGECFLALPARDGWE